MTPSNLYPIQHADSGRSGAIKGLTQATGRLAWSVEVGPVSTAHWPAEVLIWQGLPLVITYEGLTLFNPEGKRQWTRAKQGGTPVTVAADGHLYLKNNALFLDSVDVQNQPVLKSAPFPAAMDGLVEVLGFWPRATDFVAVTLDPPPTENRLGPPGASGAKAEGPRLTVVRNRYPTPYGDFLKRFDAKSSLVPLLVPGKAVVAMAIAGEVVRVDVDRKTELPRFKLPIPDPVEWSVDASEVYTVAGYDHGHKAVAAVSALGETLWRWADPAESDKWAPLQPPIRFGSERVYALTEGRILAFDSGRIAWAHDLRSEALKHGATVSDGSFEIKDGQLLAKGAIRHGSALADGSLLVTSGKSLFHLSAKGNKIFSVTLDAVILNSPVVDGQGNIYLTTATRLFKIQ